MNYSAEELIAQLKKENDHYKGWCDGYDDALQRVLTELGDRLEDQRELETNAVQGLILAMMIVRGIFE